MSSNVLTPINPTPTPTDATNPDIQVTGAPPATPAPARQMTQQDRIPFGKRIRAGRTLGRDTSSRADLSRLT